MKVHQLLGSGNLLLQKNDNCKAIEVSSIWLKAGQTVRCATCAPGRFYVACNLNEGYIQEICENTFSKTGVIDIACVASGDVLYLTSSFDAVVYRVSLGNALTMVSTFTSSKHHKELTLPTSIAANVNQVIVGCKGHVVVFSTEGVIQFLHSTSPFTAADNILLDMKDNVLMVYNKERQIKIISKYGECLCNWDISFSSANIGYEIIPHKPSFDANGQLVIAFIRTCESYDRHNAKYKYKRPYYVRHNYKYFLKGCAASTKFR